MNLSEATLARSDQLNADDLVAGPRTFTVKEVRRGDSDQPVAIVLAEFPANRPFKPSKTVVRILSYAWGEETDYWPENPRFTLYRDAKVKWAGQEIGGIRISHMSNIESHPDIKNGQLKIALAESKGKKSLHVVDVLPNDAPTSPPIDENTVSELAALRNEWKTADPKRKKAIEAEVAALTNPQNSGAESAPETPSPDSVAADAPSAPESDVPDPHDGNDPWVKTEGGE
jgi:hypothetical protein